MAWSEPVALTVLTGFLGAGKTTLVNRLLKQPGLTDTAVVVNEFGEVAIDHLLMEQASDDLVELGGGCLCCTARGALVETLAALAERPRRLARVVVETTGLADPVPVLQAVMAHPVLARHYRLESVVTVVDAVNGRAILDSHEEARSQVAVADRIVVTKAELATADTRQELLQRLAAHNPQAELLDSRHPAATEAGVLLRPGFAGSRSLPASAHAHDHAHGDHEHHHRDEFQSISLVHDRPMPRAAIENFLDLLVSQQGDGILRIKGLVETVEHPERPLVVQAAQRLLHAPDVLPRWPDEDRSTRIVIIGRTLDADYARRIFAAFAGKAAVDTPDRAALENNPLAISGYKP